MIEGVRPFEGTDRSASERARGRLSYANVVATLALFLAIGGGTFAVASALKKNSVKSKQIKNGKVKNVDLADDAVDAAKVADGSLLSADFAAGQLPKGPKGDTGPAGRSALGALHNGETIRGVWAVQGQGGSGGIDTEGVTFPIPAPIPVDSFHVVFAGGDTVSGGSCTGTAASPSAPAGFVCIYPATAVGLASGLGYGARGDPLGNSTAVGDGSTGGFIAEVIGTAGFHANGTWAYRAP